MFVPGLRHGDRVVVTLVQRVERRGGAACDFLGQALLNVRVGGGTLDGKRETPAVLVILFVSANDDALAKTVQKLDINLS